jgi:FkbM family methyltransferase
MSMKVRRRNLTRVARNVDGARGQAMRACMFLLAGRVTPYVGVEHDGLRYVLSTRDAAGVSIGTFVKGFWGEDTISRMDMVLKQHAGITALKGLTVLEVGANIGTETVSMLVRHGVERVVAVEPDPENVRFLRANLALNGVQDRVKIHQMALSDADGTLTLEYSEKNWGDHRIRVPAPSGPDLLNEGQRVAVEIPAHTLDSLADAGEIDLDDIDLVWMDAQGHEAHILAGAELLAAAGIPIVTEYWPYGLRRVGALDRFHALVAQRHSVVIDLRTDSDEPPMVLDATRIADLASRYEPNHGDDPADVHADLLLLPR